MNSSKMVIVIYPRTRKLTKEELAEQCSLTAIMAMMSIGGTISQGSTLAFDLKDKPGSKGLPRGWFTGDSQFAIETKRVMSAENYHTLYEWCKREGVPAFSGECSDEPSVMVIGPYWNDTVDELFTRAVPLDKNIRPYSTENVKKTE